MPAEQRKLSIHKFYVTSCIHFLLEIHFHSCKYLTKVLYKAPLTSKLVT